MYYHLIILFSFVFYLSGNIGQTVLGLPETFIIALPLAYSLFIIAIYKRNWTDTDRQSLWIIVGATFFLVFKYVADAESDLEKAVSICILPALLVLVLPKNAELRDNLIIKSYIAKLLLIFYLTECGIALMEFVMREHIFGWIEMTYSKGLVSYGKHDFFRSVALLGSPLNNALVVTIIMLFFLFNPAFTTKRKILLWIIGLIAVFCFNARMAIVINLVSMVIFILRGSLGKYSNDKKVYILFLFIVCTVVSLSYYYGLGERLWETGNVGIDGSIRARVKLFGYIMHRNWTDYLWGSSQSEIQKETVMSIKVDIIENFWVQYIFRFGIIATTFFTIFYFRLCRSLLRLYPIFEKVTISSLFIILASSNISLATQYIPLTVFLLCAYTYSPIEHLIGKYVFIIQDERTKQSK